MNMNWLRIDEILRSIISKWDGTEEDKNKILFVIKERFDWNDSQAKTAARMHFKVYKPKKME